MDIRIEYCVQWNYEPQAAGLAAELRAYYPEAEFELVESSGGAFEVSVNGRQVFSKLKLRRFPSYQELPELIG